MSNIEAMIHERSTKLKQLIDSQTTSLLHQLNAIKDTRTKELEVVAREISKHLSAVVESDCGYEMVGSYDVGIEIILNDPFSDCKAQFIPSLDRELFPSLNAGDGNNIVGRISITDSNAG